MSNRENPIRDPLLKEMDDLSTNRFHMLITLLSGMGVFLEGYDFTNIASALIFLVPYFKLTALLTSLLSISTYVGTLIGALVIGYLADLVGRKRMYVLDIVLYIVFALTSGLSVNYLMLFLSRIGLGFGIGADQAISFSIIGETAPKRSRGRLNAFTWVLWTIASLLTYVISFVLYPFFGYQTWRVLFLLSVIPGIIVVVGRAGIPETPRFLLSQGRIEDAIKSASKLGVNVQAINTVAQREKSMQGGRWGSLFKGRQLRRTVYLAAMWFGITVNTYGIGYFTPYIFKTLGFTATRSLFGGVFVATFALLGSLTMFALVERAGRRLLASVGFGVLALIDLTISFLAHSISFPLLLTMFSLFQYAAWIGPAGLVGVVAPEVFPTRIRSTGTGFGAAMGRVGSILGIFLLPILLHAYGLSNAMLFFFADAAAAFLIMVFLGVETKGKSLEELVGG